MFRFIEADLNSHPPKNSSLDLPNETVDSFIPGHDLPFPKSLYLIQPLSTSYTLNPVAKTAQASVPIPDGLDLDAWIVPPSEDSIQDELAESTDRKNKSKKGKGKDISGEKKNSRKKQKDNDGELIALASPEPEIETTEERAERERVRQRCSNPIAFLLSFQCSARPKDWNSSATIHTTLLMISL